MIVIIIIVIIVSIILGLQRSLSWDCGNRSRRGLLGTGR